MKKRLLALLLVVAVLLGFTACSVQNGTNDTTDKSQEQSAAKADIKSLLETADIFTERDMRTDVDTSQAVSIKLGDKSTECSSEKVKIKDNKIKITDNGVYIISGRLGNGQIIVDADDTDKVQLVLKGVDITCKSSAAIYVKQAKKVFITPFEKTENILTTSGEFKADGDTKVDGTIFSKDDITLCGLGALEINSTAHGVVSKDELKITRGSYTINAVKHCLAGKDCVAVVEGTLNLTSGKDAIHSSNKKDETKGFIYIKSGKIIASSDGDGIDAVGVAQLDGGTIDITKSKEGIEGAKIQLNGGTLNIKSSDDGMNASTDAVDSSNPMAVDDNAYIEINGGKITIDASGDGIDSNGAIYINGGDSVISGAPNGADSAVDYGSKVVIAGGNLVATGMSNMAESVSDESTQGSMLVTLSTATDKELTLKQGSKTLVSHTPPKRYDSVLISTPDIVKGGKYTLTAGDEKQEIEMTDITYGEGGMGAPGGMQRPNGFGDMPQGEMPSDLKDFDGKDFEGKEPPNKHFPDNGERPILPDGFDGDLPQGEMPQPPNGEMPSDFPQGDMPQPPDMNNTQ